MGVAFLGRGFENGGFLMDDGFETGDVWSRSGGGLVLGRRRRCGGRRRRGGVAGVEVVIFLNGRRGVFTLTIVRVLRWREKWREREKER